VPLAASFETQVYSGWISDTVLAYVVQAEVSHTLSSTLHFFDAADPRRSLPVLPGIRAYSLSPDHTRAIVALDPPTPDGTPYVLLAVMPAWGPVSAAIPIGVVQESPGAASVWSPDSRQIAFVNYDWEQNAFTLRIADAATGNSREILGSGGLDKAGFIPALIAWSPAGDQLAVVLQSFASRIEGQFWLDLVKADGSGLITLLTQPGFVNHIAFSADGQYLAAAEYDSGQQSVQDGYTVIYDLRTGGLVDTLEHTWSFTWSPTGHRLAVIGIGGVDLLTNLDMRVGQNVTTDTCSEVQWNPLK
jgi:WD40 repeat protein